MNASKYLEASNKYYNHSLLKKHLEIPEMFRRIFGKQFPLLENHNATLLQN